MATVLGGSSQDETQVVNNHGDPKSPNWGFSPSKVVRKSPKDRVVGPLSNGLLWLINGSDPDHLLTGMILQDGAAEVGVSFFGGWYL